MHVKIRLFARLRELAGASELTRDVPDGAVAMDAWQALVAEFPTLAEQGLAGYDFQSWYGLWAPKGTPREICQRINTLMRETMQEPAIAQRLNASLLEPVIETSEESKAYIAAEVPKHVALLKKAGFEAQ